MASCFTAMCIVGMLLFGSLNTVLLKYQMTIPSIGREGKEKPFEKPWFLTLSMFLGMVLSLALVAARNFKDRLQEKGKLNESLIDSSGTNGVASVKEGEISYGRKVCLVVLPSVFDMLAIGLSLTGLLFVPASIWQIMRGAAVIFAEIISVLFLDAPQYKYKWLGVTVCVLGIAFVGIASVKGAQETATNSKESAKVVPVPYVIMGIGLILLGQVVQAAQMVAEEFLMKKVDLEALQVIGYEGFWGVIVMVLVVLPLVYLLPGNDVHSQEDTIDSFTMLANSSQLLLTFLFLVFSCLTYNLSGIGITNALTAVHRVICEAMRTLVVWTFALAVYAYDPQNGFGEPLNSYSIFEVLGFLVLMLGQMIYGAMIRIPTFKYPVKSPAEKMMNSPMRSPSVMKSPLYALGSDEQ